MAEIKECRECKNTNCLIKKHLYAVENSGLLDKKHTINCKKGQSFIIEGSPVHGIYFIKSGVVKIMQTGINERMQILRLSKDGEMVGHRGFGTSDTYNISAITMEDTILCNFSNEQLYKLLRNIPDLTYDFMLHYADELNKSETKVRKFAQMTVREKVIDAILYILRKFGQDKDYLNIVLSRKEIADFAGTTDEQVIRIISSLKKEGLLHANGKQIGITDIPLLKKEISEHNFFLNS